MTPRARDSLNPTLHDRYSCSKDIMCIYMNDKIYHQTTQILKSHISHPHHQQQQQQQQGHVVAPVGQPIPQDSSRTWQGRIESHACYMVKLKEPGMHARIQVFCHLRLFHFKRCMNKARGHEWICKHINAWVHSNIFNKRTYCHHIQMTVHAMTTYGGHTSKI